ncbi:hypothetical protein B0H17DRAFT_1101268 [Mycena rosella]|uniref:Uncharacterized protein n=1 Tax=Mycena rosella TaxID=1033263 RepID=A0AAD7G3I7_MYCRO|nr:hypothetical protein B0H17DRAFT_1101268 [Mycena rosella]
MYVPPRRPAELKGYSADAVTSRSYYNPCIPFHGYCPQHASSFQRRRNPRAAEHVFSFGVMYTAVVISAALYGAGIVQGWIYYQKYWRKDPLMNKLMVVLVLTFDTCQHTLLTGASLVYCNGTNL